MIPRWRACRHCEARNDEAIQLCIPGVLDCFADLVSGAHSRGPVARYDGVKPPA
jgi:hypothetical protein